MDERYGRGAHSRRDANAHVACGFVLLAVRSRVASPVAAERKEAGRFVNEATATSDAEWNSVANHPTGLGKERAREEVEGEEAPGPSETLSKQRRRKREAKAPH